MRPLTLALFVALAASRIAAAQEMPADYAAALKVLNRGGDFRGNVLRISIPRNDLTMAVAGVLVPIPLGFGSWIAMTKGESNMDVMMGDLVLTENEVNPVMSAVLNAGLDVTALHNHFLRESPRLYYLHVHGVGSALELAKKIRPGIDLIAADPFTVQAGTGGDLPEGPPTGATLAKIVGHTGEQNGPVYRITIGRDDLDVRDHGARIESRMGLNTWAAFAGSDDDAVVAGDVAMLAAEVTPVLKGCAKRGCRSLRCTIT